MGERYVGKPIVRTEGLLKAQGKAMYAGDYSAPDMLYLKLVRSPVAHGRLVRLDTLSVPEGVHVFTAADLPCNLVEDIVEDQPVLAVDYVRFQGEAVAIVAAGNQREADETAAAINVIVDPLVIIETPRHAMMKDVPKLHPGGNLLGKFQYEKGSVADGFADCALVLEDEFITPIQDHACMEPEAAFCRIDEDGTLLAYTSTQNVFHDQRMICRMLNIEPERVRVVAATVGGGFGGKDGNTAQLFAAAVCWLTGRPARLVLTREESLATTYKRHSAEMHVKIGFSQCGTMLAFDGSCLLDTGAYAGLGPAVLGLFSEHFAGPYKTPNTRLDVKLLYTNKPPSHAMRGFGSPQGAFATETLISRAAVLLGIDEIDIRRRNALKKGDIASLGQTLEHDAGLTDALNLVESSTLWQEYKTKPEPGIGYGLAAGYLSCGLGKNIPDSAKVEIRETYDNCFVVNVGMVDIGQGSRVALHAMAADALSTTMDQIELNMADTETTYDCAATSGSRSTFIAGNALLAAVEQYKENKKAGLTTTRHIGEARFPESSTVFETAGFPHAMYTFLVQAVKLRVDPVSGTVELLDIYGVTEAGRIINPLSMDGQIQGGTAMSIGFAFGENCRFVHGQLINKDYSTYLLPTAMDVPPIRCAYVDAYEQSGPLGVKGAAEVATVAIAPAIGSAISQLTGASLNVLPFDIEGLWFASRANRVKNYLDKGEFSK